MVFIPFVAIKGRIAFVTHSALSDFTIHYLQLVFGYVLLEWNIILLSKHGWFNWWSFRWQCGERWVALGHGAWPALHRILVARYSFGTCFFENSFIRSSAAALSGAFVLLCFAGSVWRWQLHLMPCSTVCLQVGNAMECELCCRGILSLAFPSNKGHAYSSSWNME